MTKRGRLGKEKWLLQLVSFFIKEAAHKGSLFLLNYFLSSSLGILQKSCTFAFP